MSRILAQLPIDGVYIPAEAVSCTITRTGSFHDPRYGYFEITLAMLNQMVKNFSTNAFGQKVLVDCSHEFQKGAAAEIIALSVEPNSLGGFNLVGQLEFTPYGISAVKDRGMIYLSADYSEDFVDNETGQRFGVVLKGAALTTRPVIKKLDAIQLSQHECACNEFICTDLKIFEDFTMSVEDKAQNDATAARIAELEKKLAASQAATDSKLSQVTESIEKLVVVMTKNPVEEVKPTQTGIDAKQLSDLMQQEFAKQFTEIERERQLAAQKERELAESAVKLFEETVRLEGKALSETALIEILKFKSEIDASLGVKAIKLLAHEKVQSAKNEEVVRQLAAKGYHIPRVAGEVHIELDESNGIKALQETVDKQLANVIQAPTSQKAKTLADAVLAVYDKQHGERLWREAEAHRQGRNILLAGGTAIASDIAVPGVIERTVAREVLYALNSMSFMQSSTLPYAETYAEVYAYRDPTAADSNAVTVYEGQSIPNSGVSTRSETFYTKPIKLGFEFSLESQLANAARQIDYDIYAELVMNATRISQERIDRLNFDEITNSTLAHSTVAVTNEAVTGVNGSNIVFPLAKFPIVKPIMNFKADGSQIGTTQFPITVTQAGTTRQPFDGTKKQAPGTYWTMRYDLGELILCNELGAPIAPASGQAIAVSYYYSTNVAQPFDVKYDPADYKEGEYFNLALSKFDDLEAILRDERYVANVDMALMRKTAQGYLKRASRFDAAYTRPGTNLDMDGNLGRINNIPTYSTQAPQIQLGNNLIIVGAKNNSRFRVMQPWSMTEPEEKKDSSGNFVGKKHAYGTMFVGTATPTYLRGNAIGMVLYNSLTRVARTAI